MHSVIIIVWHRIYRSMAQYRTYPEGLFGGSLDRLQQLDYAWETSGQ